MIILDFIYSLLVPPPPLAPPTECEACATLTGLCIALSIGRMDIIIESNCLTLVFMLLGAIAFPQHLSGVMWESAGLSLNFLTVAWSSMLIVKAIYVHTN